MIQIPLTKAQTEKLVQVGKDEVLKGRATLGQLDSLFKQQNMGEKDRKKYLEQIQHAKKEADSAPAKAQPAQSEKKSSGAFFILVFLLLLGFLAYMVFFR